MFNQIYLPSDKTLNLVFTCQRAWLRRIDLIGFTVVSTIANHGITMAGINGLGTVHPFTISANTGYSPMLASNLK
jgi:hypothetical protein